MVLFTFSVVDQKYSVWANLVPKFKILYNEFWYLDLFKYAEFNGNVHFFWFRPEILFLGGKFGPKNQIFEFKLKFGT